MGSNLTRNLMRRMLCCVLPLLMICTIARAAQNEAKKPDDILKSAIARLTAVVEPAANAKPKTLTTQLKITRAEGLPSQAKDAIVDIAFEAPDHLMLTAKVG